MAYSLAVQTLSGIWEVQCVVCSKSLGTFNTETMTEAVRFAQDKGGIMCPLCRAMRCEACGGELQNLVEQFLGCCRCFREPEKRVFTLSSSPQFNEYSSGSDV